MPRSPRQKQKLLLIRQYLEENTDEQHPASTAELIAYLDARGVSAERKSIYDDMETLRDFGLDVVKIRQGNQSGWYLGERDFQLPELRLLVDSIQSSRFLTRKKSLELIGKLEKLTSVHQAKGLRRQVFVKNRIKSMNESIYYLVDELHSAIGEDRRIRFRYFNYNAKGERELRRNGEWYHVSPWALLWDNENYYLVAYDAADYRIKHYRVDKMQRITLTDQPRLGREHVEAFDMANYAKSVFGMFGGEETAVTLEGENRMVGVLIDRFGKDILLVPSDENHFEAKVNVAVSAQFFGWIMALGDGIRITGPGPVVQKMKAEIRRLAARCGLTREELAEMLTILEEEET
jgi:predicted DNA-binding transcriptional regulator YafY